MKKGLLLSFFTIIYLTFSPLQTTGAMEASLNHKVSTETALSSDTPSIHSTDRKLSFKEKATLLFLTKKMKKRSLSKAKRVTDNGQKDGLAIASFVTGLLGLLGFIFLPIGLVFSLLAIIFGLISLNRRSYDPTYKRGKGLAIAGLVLGSLSILGFILLILVVLYG